MFEQWPQDGYLVILETEGQRRWEVGLTSDLPSIVGAVPVWPPFGAFAVADLAADAEVDLIEHLRAIPDLGLKAIRRLQPEEVATDPAVDLAELDWDD